MPESGSSAIERVNTLGGRRPRRWIVLGLKIAISVGLLAFVARQASWDQVTFRLNEIIFANVLLALSPLVAVTFFIGFRWSVVASTVARPVRLVEAWIVSMIGAALDQVFVMLSGDAYRIWWLSKGAQSRSHAVAGVLLDRVAGILGIALLVLAFLPRFMKIDSPQNLFWVPAALATAVVGGFAALLVADRLPFDVSRNRWLMRISVLSSSGRKVFLSPATAIPALGAAVLVHAGVSTCIALLAWALGVGLGLAAALTVVPIVMLISLLPISIGGWGVREGAMIVGLGLVGVESSDALLISIMFGLGAAAIGVSGGILWLLGLPAKPAQVQSR